MATSQEIKDQAPRTTSATAGGRFDATQTLLAVEAGDLGIWSLDFSADMVWGSQLTAKLLGLPDGPPPWPAAAFFDCLHDDDLELVYQMVEAARRGDPDLISVNLRRKPRPGDGSDKTVWLSMRARVTETAPNGKPRRLTGLIWRITDTTQKQHRADRQLAALDHRVNNTFAVIRALVNLGETAAPDMTSFADTLRNQVEALATANKLSTQMARTKDHARVKVSLFHVIEAALASRIVPPSAGNVTMSKHCPPEIRLAPADLSNVAMILFELATNAVKHGVLGAAGGALDVSVQNENDGTILLSWIETKRPGGQPARPEGGGFGKVILDLCASNLEASYSRTFTHDGMQFEIKMRPQA